MLDLVRYVVDINASFHLKKNYFQTTENNPTGLIYTTLADKIYNFTLTIESTKKVAFNATTTVRTPGPNGYLNAMEYPLLPVRMFQNLKNHGN